MKVITHVNQKIGKPYIKKVHKIKDGHSAEEEFEYWSDVCCKAMKNGKIVDYQVELVYFS